jgi:hypothetical protein
MLAWHVRPRHTLPARKRRGDWRVRAAWTAVLLAGLACQSPGAAQTKGAAAKEAAAQDAAAKEAADKIAAAAKAKFDAGQAEVGKGNLKRARALFLASKELAPTSGAFLNLADCEEKLGRLADASRHYQEALGLLKISDRRVAFAKERIAALEARVPRLRIDLAPSSPPGARVLLDGRALDPSVLGTEMRLDPGSYTVAVSAPRREERAYPFKLEEKERKTLSVEVGEPKAPPVPTTSASAAASATPAAPPEPPPPSSPLRPLGFVIGALGIAGIGVGLGIGFGEKAFLLNVQPYGTGGGRPDLWLAATGAVAGGILIAEIGALLAIHGSQSPPATVQAAVGPNGAGLLVQTAF